MLKQPMSRETLNRVAPSVFAAHAWEGVSDKYTFVPTIEIIDRLRDEFNMVPIAASEAYTRKPGTRGFQRHHVRLASADMLAGREEMKVGDTFPTVSLINSHNTAAALAIEAGLYRLVCSNGLMLPDSMAQSVRVRHSGNVGDIIEGVYSVVEGANKMVEVVAEYQAIQLPYEAQLAFAKAATELRESTLPVRAEQLLLPRRMQDRNPSNTLAPKSDLYTTLNVVQENIVRGGQYSRNSTGRRTRTRAIADISADVRINKALFVLAESLKQQVR